MPSDSRIILDVSAFVAQAQRGLWSEDGFFKGLWTIVDDEVSTQLSSRSNTTQKYALSVAHSSSAGKQATGWLQLGGYKFSAQPLMLLLFGQDICFDEFAWQAYCPISHELCDALHFDTSSELFVAAKAVGSRPPAALHRALQNGALIDLMSGLSDSPEDLANSGKTATSNTRNKLLDAIREVGVEHFKFDMLFAESGLPMVVWGSDGELDLLATIENSRGREKYPTSTMLRILRERLKSEN